MPTTTSLDLFWTKTGPDVARGGGAAADPLSPAAFSGSFADARCRGWVETDRMGFTTRSDGLNSDGFYASLGTEKNGAMLT